MTIDINQKGEEREEYPALLRKWQSRVDDALRDCDKYHQKYKHWRKVVNAEGMRTKSAEPNRVYPYTIYSAFAALIPALYAKNPEIECRPTAAAAFLESSSAWISFADTCEKVLSKELVENTKIKTKLKNSIRTTLTCGVSWLKLNLQADYYSDSLLKSRMNDSTDNAARLRMLSKEDSDASREEMKMQIQTIENAIEGNGELSYTRALVVDCVAPEDIFILDKTVGALSNYAEAGAIAHRVWMSTEGYKSIFGHTPPETEAVFNHQVLFNEEFEADRRVQVFEVWDKKSGMVFTFAKGAKKWAREPYAPQPNGQRFYPFFALIFNETDGTFHPLSDTQLLEDFQDEYANIRTEINRLRRWNKPKFAVSKQGDLSADDANRLIQTLRENDTGDWVAVNVPPNQSLSASLQQLPIPSVNLGLFDPSGIFRDIEMATRSGDAARGFINKAKTATEAEILSMGMQSGISERQDTLEEMMNEMAVYALQLINQAYEEDDIAGIIGTEATWQRLDSNTLFRHLNVNIKSGSMAKPNKFQEREQWMQLAPQINQTIVQITQLQAQGMSSAAQAMRKILEETIARFDERIDLDEFLPDVTPQPQMMQAQQATPQGVPQQGGPPDAMEQVQTALNQGGL